ncbi:MAG: hypothetical protein JKY66_04200 [Spongiibacteraceae bacterium]|nr:hypothetical protein [Spongiibacteraceae bacterium]MBN4055275.1 hypothetical protein [bacterium AH-315-K03]
MQQFDQIDPLTIKQHPNLIAELPDDRKPHKTWYFLVIDDHMIIANTTFKEKKQKWLHYQIEFPKRGLQWYLDSLQEKFFKTEAKGGLPKGTFHDKTEIDGERLKLGRAFNADGNRGGGYSFVTLDRKEEGFAKEYTFTDELLFKHGLLLLLEDLASKIATGQL